MTIDMKSDYLRKKQILVNLIIHKQSLRGASK